jgi:surfactin synthase thioesterase subunit
MDDEVKVGLAADNKSFIRSFNEAAQATKTVHTAVSTMADAVEARMDKMINKAKRWGAAFGIALGAGLAFGGAGASALSGL